MLLLRSLIFQFCFFGSAVVAGFLVLLAGPFGYPARFKVCIGWGRFMLWAGKAVCDIEYVFEGTENIPEEASVVLIKHSSVFETYAQLVIFPPQTWVLKRELHWIPLFGWGLALMKPIAINRKAGHRAVTQVIQQGKERLAEGIWISVFPEGTRMPPGETRKYGVSGAALAVAAGCKIVPVAHNAGDFWPRRSFMKRPGLVRFCIGPPIDPAGRPPKDVNLEVQDWIETKMLEISSVYKARAAKSDVEV
ncbi:MAG: lysophospholipid acyltransferase family protein [Woeseia sp.]